MSEAKRGRYTYDYPRPSVTVDVVVIMRARQPSVLLIQRKHDPFAGMWAIPGGYVEMEESLADAARRELREETGVEVAEVEQLHTFGDVNRDPRGRTISVAYLAIVNDGEVNAKAADDASEVGWHALARLPPLAFDHADIMAFAKQRLREKGSGGKKRQRKTD